MYYQAKILKILNYMQRYLISYEFADGEDQEEGGEMLINWYESGGPQNSPTNQRQLV